MIAQLSHSEPRGAHEDPRRQVVHARLEDVEGVGAHVLLLGSTSFDLYSLRCSVPHGTSSTSAPTTRTSRTCAAIAAASDASACPPRASSTRTGSGGSCLTPAARGRTRTWP